ncbi:MAG: DUF6588 family protein [Balneolales bacterium]
MIFVLMAIPGKNAHAQIGDLGEMLEAGADDATLLVQEYLKPFGSGFGAGINSGWVDRANTHGVPGFHLKVNLAVAMVPDAHRSFNVNEIGLEELELLEGDPNTPTFSGDSDPGPRLGINRTINGETVTVADFRMPEGVGLGYVPTPMLQAGAGLPKNTDVMLRLIPPTDLGDYGKLSLYGLGVKHELNQWVPGGGLWPVTLSIMGGFTTFRSSADLDAPPSGEYQDPDNLGGPGSPTWDDQAISLQTDAFTMNLLVGKSLPIISVYAGVGFETATTAIKMEGNYPFYVPAMSNEGTATRDLTALVDPINISLDGSNTVRALAGIRISLPLISLNVDYTAAEYSMVTAGFGISFR